MPKPKQSNAKTAPRWSLFDPRTGAIISEHDSSTGAAVCATLLDRPVVGIIGPGNVLDWVGETQLFGGWRYTGERRGEKIYLKRK